MDLLAPTYPQGKPVAAAETDGESRAPHGAACRQIENDPPFAGGGYAMKLYRVNKLSGPGGAIIKKKHILAPSDREAVQQAVESSDCPICDVLRDGEKVGSIL